MATSSRNQNSINFTYKGNLLAQFVGNKAKALKTVMFLVGTFLLYKFLSKESVTINL